MEASASFAAQTLAPHVVQPPQIPSNIDVDNSSHDNPESKTSPKFPSYKDTLVGNDQNMSTEDIELLEDDVIRSCIDGITSIKLSDRNVIKPLYKNYLEGK
ncbi:hypothetical protein V6N11_069377 [Hibiscus sabdariffa]|uniref:Uncharacterized protein n=2 Tax=Hibiscus sabdariffa TaxID=183260 RepID=A0ABR2EA93_9ROSI